MEVEDARRALVAVDAPGGTLEHGRMWARSTSSSVRRGARTPASALRRGRRRRRAGDAAGSDASRDGSSGPVDRMTARSMTFSSSRTLPGQA